MTRPHHGHGGRRAAAAGAALLLTATCVSACSSDRDRPSGAPTPASPATSGPSLGSDPTTGPGTAAPESGEPTATESASPTAAPGGPTLPGPATQPPAPAPGPTRTPPKNPGCALAPPLPEQDRTLFGTSVSTSSKLLHESLADEESRFGPMSVIRTFDPHLPPEGSWSRREEAIGSRMLVTSFRMAPQEVLAGQYDAGLRHYFRTAPKDPLILWSYIHEPEPLINSGEFTAEQYRAAFRHVVRLAGEQCRANLFPTMILTGWTAEPDSERNWRDYYAGDDYVSVVAWDPYNSATSQPTKYDTPHNLYRAVAKASRQSGKPWGIAETGSVRVQGDGGERRGQWLSRIGQWFADQGASFVTYFQSTRDGEFLLLDDPSVAAWRKWVRWSHQ